MEFGNIVSFICLCFILCACASKLKSDGVNGVNSCSISLDQNSYTIFLEKYVDQNAHDNGDSSKRSSNRGNVRLSTLEKRLARSMRDLISQIRRGVRKIQQHLGKTGNHKKRDIYKKNKRSFCPAGFTTVYNGDACYLLSNFDATWYEAKDFCTAINSDLLALGSIREYNLVTFLIKNNQAHSNRSGWWTGGTYLAKSNQWMWISETALRPFKFIKWAGGQPNDTMSQCVYLNRQDNYLWHDDNCNVKNFFVCETLAERV
ncbi:hypothetical protein FSP39_006980 [Pinctada imbricata]|uniref:C-type lectin domain-containing protein n=1 Tax=Pinctada imbricata TaxID=66713 RepID=A0AA88Y9J1_PINIB|nr:hypothetical protein FSP39_006980 [Pinctada imbricata]